ncbi:MAG: hypothetical protein V4510_09795 [bacterium]
MQGDLHERARNALHDYLIWLRDRGDTSEGYANQRYRNARRARGTRQRHKSRGDFGTSGVGVCTAGARRGVDAWYRRKENSWRSGGRMRPDGLIRVSPRPDKPWTLERVAQAVPEAGAWDHIAALIFLDGVVRRQDMKNIREVVEGIADARLKRALLDPENTGPIRTLIREELDAYFGEMAGSMKRAEETERPAAPGAPAKRLCGKCRKPGHKSTTCGRAPETPPPAPHDDDPEADGAAA